MHGHDNAKVFVCDRIFLLITIYLFMIYTIFLLIMHFMIITHICQTQINLRVYNYYCEKKVSQFTQLYVCATRRDGSPALQRIPRGSFALLVSLVPRIRW